MTDALSTSHPLYRLPALERREALETLVTERFCDALLMNSADEVPLTEGFFDLGLTSLRLLEIRKWLEQRLGFGIDTAVLFNRPTVEELVDYLVDAAPDVPADPGAGR